jgi:hypothetical protein
MKIDHQNSKIARTCRISPVKPFWQFFILLKWLPFALALAAVPAQATTHSTGNVTLFVHGFGPGAPINYDPNNHILTLPNAIDCSGYWGDLPSFMRQQGYTGQFIYVAWYQNASNCDVNLHNWGSYDETLSWVDIGAALSQYIYQNFTSKGIPVDIVAHSMGGMVTRSAIYGASGKAPPFCWLSTCDTFSPPIDVGTAITAGSPHAGSNTTIVKTCANLAYNQQICGETLPGSRSEIWVNGVDANNNIIHPAAGDPQGKFGTQWINIAATDTSPFHLETIAPLPYNETPISDGVIDTHSARSMTILDSNKLTVPGDVSHLEFFLASKGSNDAGGANNLIVNALKQDYAWFSRNWSAPDQTSIGPVWALYSSGLNVGDFLISANGSYGLRQQVDGNLVIYDGANRPLWARGGSYVQNARSVMQDDGNLVTYSDYLPAVSGSGSAIWATNTAGNGPSYLGLMDDGNLIIVQTPYFAQRLPSMGGVQPPSGNFGGNVTWKAFTGPNSPLASINPNSTPGGWCMEVPGGQISDNGHDPVTVAICNDSPQQNFVISGQYGQIRALGRCLTNNGVGQSVTMEVCDGVHQNWVAELGVIRPADGTNNCVDVSGSNFVEGQSLALTPCSKSAEQNWVEPRIKNFSGSGKCLGGVNPNVDNNNQVVLATCTGQVNQQWYTSGWWRNGGYRGAFQTKNNQCLDVPNQNFVQGQQLQYYHCNNTQAQDWVWFNDYSIRPAAQMQLCVDVTHSNSNDGTAIQLYSCNGTYAQQWDPPGGPSPNAPAPAPPPAPKWMMATGDVLEPAGNLLAANNQFRLAQQGGATGDGNLVIYETNARPGALNGVRPLWGRSGAIGGAYRNAYTKMQSDGNLVTYQEGANDKPAGAQWSSGSNGNGPSIAYLQDDGNLMVVPDSSFVQGTNNSGNFGSHVTWSAFGGNNSQIAGINPQSVDGGFCWDIPNGTISPNGGDAVQVWTCNNGINQAFVVEWDGTIRALGRCVTYSGLNRLLTMEICDGSSTQHWDAQPDGSILLHGGRYPWECIDLPNSNFANGQRLQTYRCNGTVAQRWVIPRMEQTTSHMCLGGANSGFNNGNPTVLGLCSGEVNQQWYTTGWWHAAGNLSSATYHATFSTKNNKCLDVPGSNFASGQQLQFWDCNGTNAQDWIWFSDQSIRPAAATYLCIDVYHSNWHDGTPIQLFNCNNTNAQTWGPPGGYSTNAAPPPGSPGGGSDGATWGITWEQKGVNYDPFPVCQCTWGMEQKVHDYTSGHRLNGDWGVYPYVTGNAMDWANQALAVGWTVNDWSHPQVNSIVVLQPYVGGAFDLGHVGWVTAVNTVNKTIDMISTNWAGSWCGYAKATIPIQQGMKYILIPGPNDPGPPIGNPGHVS